MFILLGNALHCVLRCYTDCNLVQPVYITCHTCMDMAM